MEYFKNRKIDIDKPVYVYRNLNRKGRVFSIKQDGLVVAHTERFVLKDCEFIIHQKAKEKAVREQRRNVHAFIKGHLGEIGDISTSFSFNLSYNPFLNQGFVILEALDVIKAKTVYTQKDQLLTQL